MPTPFDALAAKHLELQVTGVLTGGFARAERRASLVIDQVNDLEVALGL
jgi:phosphoglycolate phosphatase-like HAD superfamily hydrolase